MDITGSVIVVLAGAACLVLMVIHETKWRRMLSNWVRTTGKVIAEIQGDETNKPIIQYEFNGSPTRFTSKYGSGMIKIGSKVVVLFDPRTGEAEELKWSNRWFPTFALGLLGIGFISFGLFT